MDRESWNQRHEERGLVNDAAPYPFLVAECASLVPGKALDLGCGDGHNAVWLAGQGWQVTAVDYSDVGIARGRELATRGEVVVTWVIEDLNLYEPPAGSFDLVTTFYVHIPLDQRNAMLAKGSAALAPGGTFLVVGHDLSNLEHGYGGPKNPSLLYTPDTISSALPGLEIVKAERLKRVVETEEGRFEAIDSFVRAKRPVGA
ncbi:MAG: class I SAM-dependent methyltransferase [Acidimicrobiia bacterium]|nr:class I SAM-dependent methyltransferase [Acidimicrobiia bacterium]